MKFLQRLYGELIMSPGGRVYSAWYFMCGILLPVSVVALLTVNYIETVKAIESLISGFCDFTSPESSERCTTVFSIRDAVLQYSLAVRVEGLTRELMLFGFFVSFANCVIQILSTFFFNVNLANLNKNILKVEKFFYLRSEMILGLAFVFFFYCWLGASFGAFLPDDVNNLRLSQRRISVVQYFFFCFLTQYLVGFTISIFILVLRSKVEEHSNSGV